jgi:signal transduction histidine kinase
VDDEARVVKALCDTLEGHGYEAVGFVAGAHALAEMRRRQFDLLLADLTMPEMDGITLLKCALELDPQLVGVIMTGDGTIATAVDAMKSGAVDYILKPFKTGLVLPVLSRALDIGRLRKENALLQRRLSERAAELEAKNKELESFSYSVSHDLGAPLRAITGYSEMLRETCVDEESRRLIEVIHDRAGKMSQLIRSLLELSHLSRATMVSKPIDVERLVGEVIEELRGPSPDGWPEVSIAALPAAVGDKTLVRQVWVNLISNAVKFSAAATAPAIWISGRTEGSEVIYSVKDNGAGFDMQYYDKLFVAFQRLHSAKTFQGTGVGLTIVQRVVMRHGGRVWAEGQSGQGAAFHFSLPAAANPGCRS